MSNTRSIEPKDIAKFWSLVDKRGPDECWTWRGAETQNGYGRIHFGSGIYYAHRLAYTLTYGEPKYDVAHRCDYKFCCNPSHLYDGTKSQNQADRNRTNLPGATGVKHVSYDKRNDAYMVQFRRNGKSVYFRRFKTLEEAAADAARVEKELE